MKPTPLLAALLLAASGAAFAADKACIIESTGDKDGKTVETKDCVANRTIDKAQFRENCDNNIKLGALFKRKVKITYVDACPAAQGWCEGAMGGTQDIHYYKRTEKELKDIKVGCGGGMLGQWHGG